MKYLNRFVTLIAIRTVIMLIVKLCKSRGHNDITKLLEARLHEALCVPNHPSSFRRGQTVPTRLIQHIMRDRVKM